MDFKEYTCKSEEICVESEFDPDEGDRPVVLCHHPQGTGFCDYREVEEDDPSGRCPCFQYAVPYHEVEPRQYLEMVCGELTGKEQQHRRRRKNLPALSKDAQEAMLPQFIELWRSIRDQSPVARERHLGPLLLGTLLSAVEAFDRLSTEEQVGIFAPADWAWRLGYALGRAPDRTSSMLHSVQALWVEVEEPEWFKPLLREYGT